MRLRGVAKARRGSGARVVSMSIAIATAFSGCANFSPDGGMSKVQELAADPLKQSVVRLRSDTDADEAEAKVRSLLKQELSADRTIEIALLNNRGLQAAFAELAAAEAQAVEFGLPPSPTFSLSRIAGSISGTGVGSALEIERQILTNVLALITLPRRRAIADAQFRIAQLRAAEQVLRVAADTRRAYYRAIASAHIVTFLEEAKLSAEAGSEIAKRLGQSGAINKLLQAREFAFYAELGGQLGAAKLRREADRERLTRLMGLWGSDIKFRLPARLPPLPKVIKSREKIEADAIDSRIDLRIAKAEIDALALTYGLTSSSRFVNVLEVRGISRFEREKRVTPKPPPDAAEFERTKVRWSGLELEAQVPLFDLGEARTRKAEETYMQAVHRLAERAVNIRSEVREAYMAYRGTYDLANHYQKEILPLRKIISDETMLRYNAMVSDLSELLVDARARITSNIAAIEALRDHHIAKTDLQVAIIGGGGGGNPVEGPRATATPDAGVGH